MVEQQRGFTMGFGGTGVCFGFLRDVDLEPSASRTFMFF